MLDDLKDRGVKFHSLTEAIDTTTPTGRAKLQMMIGPHIATITGQSVCIKSAYAEDQGTNSFGRLLYRLWTSFGQDRPSPRFLSPKRHISGTSPLSRSGLSLFLNTTASGGIYPVVPANVSDRGRDLSLPKMILCHCS